MLAGVSKSYYNGTPLERRALEGVDLTLRAGQVTLLAGGMGSGKSTILRIAAGLEQPDAGMATLAGRPVRAGEVGLLFQKSERQLFASTVIDDVAFGLVADGMPRSEAREAAAEALASVGLDPAEYGERSPFGLSGGQARRVAFAGMLVRHPAFVLLDEPLAGLDAQGSAFVVSLISKLCAEGAGVLVVSHDLDMLLPESDEVVLLKKGRVVWGGSTRELVAAPYRFDHAGLELPALLRFQERMGVPRGSYVLSAPDVAQASLRWWTAEASRRAGVEGQVAR